MLNTVELTELNSWVEDLLVVWMREHRSFTKWEVTQALRQIHPDTFLPHESRESQVGVRRLVADRMRVATSFESYDSRIATRNGTRVVEYFYNPPQPEPDDDLLGVLDQTPPAGSIPIIE